MGRNRAVRFAVTVLLLITTSTWSSPHHARAWPPARISSVSADFFFPDLAWISADGRIVVMSSEGDYHLHVYDRATGRGWPLDIPVRWAEAIVPDGSALLLWSNTNLAGDGELGFWQLYRYDLPNGPGHVVSIDLGLDRTFRVNGSSYDGRYILITAYRNTDQFPDMHNHVGVFDTTNGSIDWVDELLPGDDRRSDQPTISADGRFVAFSSHLGNCYVVGDGCPDRTYVVDREVRSVEMIDVAADGGEPDGMSFTPQIAANGRFVIFFSRATDIVPGASATSEWSLYLRDTATSTTELVTNWEPWYPWSASVSGDGQRIAYIGRSPMEYMGSPAEGRQPFLLDRSTGERGPIAFASDGAVPDNQADWTVISSDGRTVFFRSLASNLVPGTVWYDVFAWEAAPLPPPPPPEPPEPPPVTPPDARTDYQAVRPARVLETRMGPNDVTVDHQFEGVGRLAGGAVVRLPVAGRAGIPREAAAVMLNVTVVHPNSAGFVTVYPCGAQVPLASSVNYSALQVLSNAVLSKVDAQGMVCLSTTAPTHVVVDAGGYVPAGGSLVATVPARMLETRVGPTEMTVDHQFEGVGRLAGGAVVRLPVAGRAGIPMDATAVMLNVTVADPDAAGFLTVYPCGDRPLASSVNYAVGQVLSNAVLAKLDDGGRVCVFTMSPADVVVDVDGYVPAGGSSVATVPARMLETRVGPTEMTVDHQFEGVGRLTAGAVVTLPVAGRAGIPMDATAVMLNVTVADPAAAGFLTVYPCGDRPLASSVNYAAGQVLSNAVLAKLDDGGRVCVFTMSPTDVVVDVNGYVQPSI